MILFIILYFEIIIIYCLFLPFISLPKAVKRRLKALKKLQLDIFNIEAKFYEEVHSLECKYTSQYKPLFDKVSTPLNRHLHVS